ncbi:MAG: DUF1186 domain-containing protein [Pirellulales bacterium]
MSSDVQVSGELDATLDRIMALLSADTDKLPEEGILEARRHREAIISRLIESIQAATAVAAAGDRPEHWSHLYALFLLAEFQAKEALPAILAAISLPGEGPFDLFGDTITEDLSSILAGLVDEPFDLLEELIRNRALNEYVRWESAGAYLCLVRDGRLTRDEAVARLRQHLREAIANRDADAATFLVCNLTDFGATEAIEEAREAFRLELVDEQMFDREYAEEVFARGEAEFQKRLAACRPTGVPDCLEVIKSWAAFSEPLSVDERDSQGVYDRKGFAVGDMIDDDHDIDGVDDFGDDDHAAPPDTIRNERRHIGRNDPCPCGSGKKFKKCCGGR